MDGEARPGVSVVVPLYNEVLNLEDLHRQLTAALLPTGRSFELVLVDDGSTDGTREKLLALEALDPRVRAVVLRRNFGQTAAFSAGFDRSRGDVVVTSDGDLQNDPLDIPLLVDRLERDDLDMVCGWRKERHDPLSKRVPSFFANRLISWATGVRLHDYGCSLKAMRGEVARGIRLYGTVRVLLDLFTVRFLHSYGTRPAHLFGLVGLAFGASGTTVLAYLAVLKLFFDEAIGGRPLLLLGALLFLTGVTLVSFGLMGELLVRTWHESQGKPIYVVQERRAGTKPLPHTPSLR
jgi:glycosyltransferase involved in cell wall biosynthesis